MISIDIGHGRGWLDPDAAASLARIDAELGHPMQVTEAGRSKAKADENYAKYLAHLAGGPWAPIALPGDQSVHCFGRAIDTNEGQEHVALLARHGWIRTVYRQGKLVEPWHFEYDPDRDEHRRDPVPYLSTTPTESNAMDNLTFYRHASDGRIFIVAGARAVDLGKPNDVRDLARIQAKNHKRAPQVYAPAPDFARPDTFVNLSQDEWNVLRAVYPPR